MARMRTYVANGGNLVEYALKHCQREKTVRPDVDDTVLRASCRRHQLSYYTDIPSEIAHMPGRESKLTGGWMRLIEDSGYQHLM